MDQDHQERIRQRAHEIWESEGRPEGRDADHWTRAQAELKVELGADSPTGQPAEPELAQPTAPAKPKRTRKTAAKAEEPPFLHDGP